jgi:hypothetical protein
VAYVPSGLSLTPQETKLTNNVINFRDSTANGTNVYLFNPHYIFRPLKGYLQVFLDTQLLNY